MSETVARTKPSSSKHQQTPTKSVDDTVAGNTETIATMAIGKTAAVDTKLTDTFLFDEDELLSDIKRSWNLFLTDKELDNSKISNHIQNAFDKIKDDLLSERWIVMEDKFYFDKKIGACWKGLRQKSTYFNQYNGSNTRYEEAKAAAIKKYDNKRVDLPTKKELIRSLTKLPSAPFDLSSGRPHFDASICYKKDDHIQGFNLDSYYLKDQSVGYSVPLIRLSKENSFNLTDIEIFFLWIVNGLTPVALKNDAGYQYLLNFKYEATDPSVTEEIVVDLPDTLSISSENIVEQLLQEDHIRADLKPYHQKMLEDIEQGHWSLWDMEKKFKSPVSIILDKKLVARDPSSSIVEGVVGIDFGTKSTVVAYQEDTTHTQLMRVGIGDLSKKVASYHYENPTIMEFNDLESFITSYRNREGRPFTQWKDLTISHTAFNALINSNAEDFNTFLSELKQWAGDKNRKLKVIDKEGFVKDLGSFLELNEESINPIELYAYYLGLYINNQRNGIFMNYILSFPVTYEVEIRNKIIASFEQGIKKSLPLELHLQEGAVEQLSVIKGASEPAAYAVVALQEYGFDPIDDEKVFYGIFDFGGGTTDFDFGIYKEANGKKQRRYDFVIEHFGAGGDRYLGGENLLELLAFEVFKKNKDKMLENSMQFVLPPECRKFPGSEILLSNSREAKMNTKLLMEKLRPFWEGKKDELSEVENGTISLYLTASSGDILAGFELDVDMNEMNIILTSRIKKGVVSFFDSLREAFSNSKINLSDIDNIHIFLAGNSSKSHLLADLFKEEVSKRSTDIRTELQYDESKDIFKIYPPLGHDNEDNPEKPTGKTGVAFGLIETRKGGKTLVIDHNTDENNINFKYYIGMSKRKKFRVVIDRDAEYNQWIDFIDASEDTFEVYYASIAMASTNQLDISDNSVKKKMLKIGVVDEDALVYIRLVNATDFEYVVATEDGIENNEYLGDIQRVAL